MNKLVNKDFIVLDRMILAKKRGVTYNPETGEVIGVRGKPIGLIGRLGYVMLNVSKGNKRYKYKGHQFAWFWVYGEYAKCIDHINGDKSDNRIVNLRSTSFGGNHWNRKGVKGYYLHSRGKYHVTITAHKKVIHIGYYDTEIEARKNYIKAKNKYHKH